MNVTFQRERAHDLWAEITPLLEKHWREIAHFPDIQLDPDVEAYNKIEETGMLRCITARVDGRLVGYAVYFVRPHIHYKSSFQAQQDVLFLLPEFRNTRIGLGLIMRADEMLRQEGVQAVMQHVKAQHNFAPLLERIGYKLMDLIYVRRFF